MTTVVNVHEAKTNLSQLLARVESGEDIVIARAGKPVVRLEPYRHPGGLRTGFLDVTTPADFFEPMTEEELAEWE
ncbi:MAG: type II toxin-antitoxin system Phd/YefM family antitoxin [Mycobacterium sp.]|nr:type II toxin-antitoxin system Phd/YefM family antitoxin [Mycobacterium sp.]